MVKLWKATLEIHVVGDDEVEAQFAAERNEEDFDNWEVEEVNSSDELPENWIAAIPWGDDDRTCKQILEGGGEER